MSARLRRTAAAVVLTAAVTALLPTVADAATTHAPAVVNGTKGNGLTISDGTRYVVMNGTRVDFGVAVRDLAWNPSGTRAAFVDGSGNLDVANANGTGRVTVAKNPGGQTWSHPTWQVTAADKADGLPAKDNLVFAAEKAGTTRLETVVATAHDATPALLTLNSYFGDGETPLPQTGNAWPSAGGSYGSAVYENTRTGDVYIRDDYLRQQGGVLVQGSEPALSPNGDEVVFVRSVAGHDHIFEETFGETKDSVRDLTPHGASYYTEPTWAPSGSTIAFRTPNGIDTLVVNGSHTPVQVSGYTGLAAYRG
jgi:hypothetical protein